jgi:ribonuclease HII
VATARRTRKPKTAAGRRRAETWRLKKLLEIERGFWSRGIELVAGVDEAGRGPLAGPVVAAAVVLPADTPIRGVDDSKRLTPQRRVALYVEIFEKAIAVGNGAASTREVDRFNILRATHTAMQRALARLRCKPGQFIVDGRPVPLLGDGHLAVVDGDEKVHCVACASVIAKVTRDRLMHRLSGRYPGYGWDQNVGYGTPEHMVAIATLGLTPHHRRSFECNQQLDLDL